MYYNLSRSQINQINKYQRMYPINDKDKPIDLDDNTKLILNNLDAWYKYTSKIFYIIMKYFDIKDVKFEKYAQSIEIPERIFKESYYDITFPYYFYNASILAGMANHNLIDMSIFKEHLCNPQSVFTLYKILNEFIPLLSAIYERRGYFDPSLPFKECVSKLGINDVNLLKYNNVFKESKLDPCILLNYIDRSSFTIKDQYKNEFIELHNIDLYLWMSHYKQWYNSTTTFDYKNTKIKIHNHTVTNYLEIPYKNGNFDMSKHPSECITRKIDMELNNRYTKANIKFQLPSHFCSGSNFRLLENGLDLINEGATMNHCIGGLDYIKAGESGRAVYLHVDSLEDPKGFTMALTRNEWIRTDTPIPRIYEAFDIKRKNNEKPSISDLQTATKIINVINRDYHGAFSHNLDKFLQ